MKGKRSSVRERTKRKIPALWQFAVATLIVIGLLYVFSSGAVSVTRHPSTPSSQEPALTGARPTSADESHSSDHSANAVGVIGTADTPHPIAAGAVTKPLRMTRSRYRTLSERCELGIADPGIRCSTNSRYVQGNVQPGTDRASEGVRHAISGRVLTPGGFGVGGVSLVASRIESADAGAGKDVMTDGHDTFTRYQAVSTGDGSYSFSDIPEGSYRIETARYGSYASLRITARTGVDYADIVLPEQIEFLVEGIVTDVTGSPLSHVTVLPVVEGVSSSKTDRSGQYGISVPLSADAKHVTLRFEAPGFSQRQQTARLPTVTGDLGTESLMRMKLDVVMQPIELTTNVRGTVTTPRGEPIANRVVELRAIGEAKRYRTVSERDGAYEFPVIPAPRTYQLKVTGFPDHPDYRADIAVTRQDYRFDVVMEPYELGTLRGRLTDPDGGPIADVELSVRNAASAEASANVRSDSAGSFVVAQAPAGATLLASDSMPALLVRGIEVEAGRESNVDVVVDWGNQELTGVVIDRHGIGVPAADVVLKWSHRSDDGITSSVTRRTATDYDGRFEFDQLGPGPHSVVVDAPGFEQVAFNHEIRRDGYNVTVRLH